MLRWSGGEAGRQATQKEASRGGPEAFEWHSRFILAGRPARGLAVVILMLLIWLSCGYGSTEGLPHHLAELPYRMGMGLPRSMGMAELWVCG